MYSKSSINASSIVVFVALLVTVGALTVKLPESVRFKIEHYQMFNCSPIDTVEVAFTALTDTGSALTAAI